MTQPVTSKPNIPLYALSFRFCELTSRYPKNLKIILDLFCQRIRLLTNPLIHHYFQIRAFTDLPVRNEIIERVSRVSALLENRSFLQRSGLLSNTTLRLLDEHQSTGWSLNRSLTHPVYGSIETQEEFVQLIHLSELRPVIINFLESFLDHIYPSNSPEMNPFSSLSSVRDNRHLWTLARIVKSLYKMYPPGNNIFLRFNWKRLLSVKWDILLKRTDIAESFLQTLFFCKDLGPDFRDLIIPSLFIDIESASTILKGLEYLKKYGNFFITDIQKLIRNAEKIHLSRKLLKKHNILNFKNECYLYENQQNISTISMTLICLDETQSLNQRTFNNTIELMEELKIYMIEIKRIKDVGLMKKNTFNELISNFLKD